MRIFQNWIHRFSTKINPKAVIRIFTITVFGLMLSACKSELYSQLDERQINEMVALLNTNGIEADRVKGEKGTFSLEVERSDFSKAITILSSQGFPRKSYQSLGEVFKADKMVSTPFEERARFMYALNQELSESISQINGVVSARVHITVPQKTPFEKKVETARASVFIYHTLGADIKKEVPVIKNLITRSVDGLMYEDVTVALFLARGSDQKKMRFVNASSSGFMSTFFFIFICGVLFYALRTYINKARIARPASPALPQPAVKFGENDGHLNNTVPTENGGKNA